MEEAEARQRYVWSEIEERVLDLQLEPVARLRAKADRLERGAHLEVVGYALARLGLPGDTPVKIVRDEAGRSVGLEVQPKSAAP